ncbi:glycosyltransferase family 2 protein [Sinirhodobacter sp. HNIBRBA609]|nr:glycosyltransferase family 2 protein [Sinirhodobacter sp. HNIBRBA609]
MTPTIVTLSSIPPRFSELGETLESLLTQSLPVQEIRLHIPERYRRFPDWDGTLPQVPAGVTIHRCAEDLGPATKILPAVRALRGHEVDLLLCDDDKIYDRDWHRRFKEQARKRPGTCIVEVGETFPDIAETHRAPDRLPRGRRLARKGIGYRLKRLLSLGWYKPHFFTQSGYVDQLSGYAGVLLRPDWFDEAVFDIPDIIWTVDDPWLSGHLERRGVPIWLNAKGRFPLMRESGNRHALLDLVEQGHDRVMADLAAIDYFRQTYGIWQPGGAVEPTNPRMTTSMIELRRRALAKG